MKLYIASDHAGFEHKNGIISYLRDGLGYEVEDMGALELDPQDDYPDLISRAAKEVSKDPENSRGIIFGGSGQGEAMVANRFSGIRAIVYCAHNPEIIKLSREHNNANVLSIGARFVSINEAKEAVKLWLEAPFPGDERHVRRISKIDELES
jgi:ribose 5-phosphate isomerase B